MNIENKIIALLMCLFFLPLLAEARDIKIGLVISKNPVSISANEPGILLNLNTNKEIIKTKKYETLLVYNSNGLISVTDKQSNTKLGAFTGPLQFTPKNHKMISCNNTWYRGELLIFTSGSKTTLTIANNIDLEDYLLSVVPSEISSKWNSEVLKAQAIAARSYALGYLGRRKEKGYDLESSTEDQLYLGISKEKWSASRAVKDTKGLILLSSENKPLIALYHSSGGGYTDSIENLWNEKPSPHIKPRPDYDNNSPYFKWSRTYTISEINKLLSTLNIGAITNIEPLSRSIANRVMYIKLTGTNGNTRIRGEEFRKYLKLPSSKFNLTIKNGYVKFSGSGFGHGLGMSQWGAKALAERGFTYKEILAHYYPGAMLAETR